LWESICPQCGARYPSTEYLGVFLAIAGIALSIAVVAVIVDGGHIAWDYLVLLAQFALVGAILINIAVVRRRRKGV